MNTANIQCLIRDTVSGMIATPNSTAIVNRNYIIERLDGFLNNKIMCEKMRVSPTSIVKEDFIN
jgi:hypothetical protein